MYLVKLTTRHLKIKQSITILIVLMCSTHAHAQENSPYSRYGIGDLVSNQNITNRGMGGISIGYADYGLIGYPFNINLNNPASLGNLSNTKNFSNAIFDIGGEVDFLTLKSNTSSEKFSSRNAVISYLQIAFPISTKKMEKNGNSWAMSFGLKPISRINYKIEHNIKDDAIDSINTLYEGFGGVNQINVSSGFKKIGKGIHKNALCVGISSGLTFGNKDYSTKTSIINDSVRYYRYNYEVKSRFNGIFINTGLQYEIHLKNSSILRLGAFANLQQNLNAKQSSYNETFGYDFNGGEVKIDSVLFQEDIKGKVILPLSYGTGFTYQSKNKQWLLGVDYECANWSNYKYYDNNEITSNSWTLRAGVEYYPVKGNGNNKKYLDYIKYRTGFYFGPDYIKTINARNNFAVTGGFSLPLTTPRYIQSRGEYVTLNTSFEIGNKSSNQSVGIKESFTRINFGVSMNARWFQKRSYD